MGQVLRLANETFWRTVAAQQQRIGNVEREEHENTVAQRAPEIF